MLLELDPDAGTGLPAPPHFSGWVLCLPRKNMNLDLTLLPAEGTVLISAQTRRDERCYFKSEL